MAVLRSMGRVIRVLLLLTVFSGFTPTSCTLVLDTDSLRRGSGQGVLPEAGSGDGAASSDALGDVPVCSPTMHDACTDCWATSCCPEMTTCTRDTRCNLALVQLEQCRRDARRAVNPAAAILACNEAFAQNGGSAAASLAACVTTNCQSLCGS
jgi:hypothetical protein